MRAAGVPDRLVGVISKSSVTTTPLLGLGEIHSSTVQRPSKVGVKCNVPLGENPTNAMIAVTCGKRADNTKGP